MHSMTTSTSSSPTLSDPASVSPSSVLLSQPAIALRRRKNIWTIGPALVALALSLSFLAVWLSHATGSAAWVGPRMKANTALCLAAVALSLLVRALRGPRRGARAANLAAAIAVGIAGMTLLEYLLGVNLGIDQLLALDSIVPESARFPNRMSPNAAASLVAIGLSLLGICSTSRTRALASHVLALLVFAASLFALIGYAYKVSVLYQPTPYIRITAHTAIALLLLGIGVLSLRTDIGITRLVVGRDVAGFLARPLIVLSLIVPILFGRIAVRGAERGLFDPSLGVALLVIATILIFVVVIAVLGRFIEAVEGRRHAAEEDLRHSARLIGELAQAATVDEVVDVAVRVGVRALGAASGGVMLVSPDGRELQMKRSTGYTEDSLNAQGAVPVTSELPGAVALRRNQAIFAPTRAQYLRDFPGVSAALVQSGQSRAAVPLSGRDRVLGVLTLTFTEQQRFNEAQRARILSLGSQCGLALDRALLFDSEKTARAHAERARGQAESANAAKDEFLAMLGHELRNPLAPISTSLELMNLKGGAFEKERTVIGRQVQHMTRLVDDLLDVSRITRGKVELRRRRLEVSECVAEAVEVVSPLLQRRQHQLLLSVPERGLAVLADPHRLSQVIANLLTNAAKYTNPGGRIDVAARAENGHAVLTVRDNGIGMAAELVPMVFGLFTQGHHTFDRAQGGLGLGLALVHSLITLHGGSVAAHSAGVGQGSEFTATLPLDAEADAVAGAAGESAPPMAASLDRLPPLERRCRVLVVDDNADAAEMLATALSLRGHEVRTAGDGPAALAVAEEFRPQLAFLDLGLPIMDGFDVARRLRARQDARPLTLIALTGYGQESDRGRTAEAGFDQHLVKPVEIEMTLAIADRVAAADRPDYS
jgi:signal transduction histidine kinase/ActR/RegA family two-component response regulator